MKMKPKYIAGLIGMAMATMLSGCLSEIDDELLGEITVPDDLEMNVYKPGIIIPGGEGYSESLVVLHGHLRNMPFYSVGIGNWYVAGTGVKSEWYYLKDGPDYIEPGSHNFKNGATLENPLFYFEVSQDPYSSDGATLYKAGPLNYSGDMDLSMYHTEGDNLNRNPMKQEFDVVSRAILLPGTYYCRLKFYVDDTNYMVTNAVEFTVEGDRSDTNLDVVDGGVENWVDNGEENFDARI